MQHNLRTQVPPKPKPLPFVRLPPALEELRHLRQWVAWDYRWKGDKWIKLPINPKSGKAASTSSPETWGTFEEAERHAKAGKLAGVGFVLNGQDDLIGIDLDKCRFNENGGPVQMPEWVNQILEHAETYAEVSPSGGGLRLLTRGRLQGVIKLDAAGIEIYSERRYLTITGHHVEQTPNEIRPAPKTLEILTKRVDAFKADKKNRTVAKAVTETAVTSGKTGDFFRTVNDAALESLPRWVPVLHGSDAKHYPGIRGYRVTSRALGRDLEEDLSYTPAGIRDWGEGDMGDPREGKRTPIDQVLRYARVPDPVQAAHWLCDHIGIDPERLGWRAKTKPNGSTKPEPSATPAPQAQPTARPEGQGERVGMPYQGVMMPIARDRLQIVLQPDPAPVFPVEVLPQLLRDAVDALEENVQAPRSLCAHSILSAVSLAAQGLANVEVSSLPTPRPLSLYLLAIAVSGERKSACDNLALIPVKQREEALAVHYDEAARNYRNAKAAADAERKKIERNNNLDYYEKLAALEKIPDPQEPLRPYFTAKEPTLEGLLNFLLKAQPSVGLFTSEGGQFLGGHGMGDDARTRTITGLTELWDDGLAQRVRAHEITRLSGRRVSVSLAAQPKVASMLLGDELARDQGFIGRFLMTMPESRIGTREIRPARALDDPRLQAFHRRISLLLSLDLPLRDGSLSELQPKSLRLDDEAYEVWRTVAQDLENNCGNDGLWYPVRAAAIKMPENIARIAGLLALFENTKAQVINGDTMATAAAIGMFYLQEALRLVGHQALDPKVQAVDELARWITEKWPHELISATNMQQSAPRPLRSDSKTIRKRIQDLLEAGVLELIGPGVVASKSYKETYRINRTGASS